MTTQTEATEKQRALLVKLASNKRNRRTNEALDLVAETLGYNHWDEAPLTKRVASAAIDIFFGNADVGLYVWAVKQDQA